MSAEKAASPCNKFQANIFNKSKCQNCFKSRELHLLTDHDMEQAKPVYGGWLCLAPEGTDFDNPMQRSRKWQRRFFILYEDGSLSFALDELPSTLPQGTVNMNLCSDITDAEPRTGQRNALCVVMPEQEIFIRGDNKEIINGWSEQLAVYLRTSKQNPKKKRKVERVATQEPSPAKMAATESSFPSSGNAAESGCARWQEDQRGPAFASTRLGPGPGDSLTLDGLASPVGSLDLVARGNQLTDPNDENQHRNKSHGSPAERILGLEAVENAQGEEAAASREGRSEARSNKREKLQLSGDAARLGTPPPQRRARSLDRRTSDTVMTPDLLNFKKGWMVKLEGTEQWKKYWFVLSADSLRYYKDSIAEEASDLEGEIDLTRCYGVSEYQVQRNYGFQIHTPSGVHTLSAMTSGIRKNWIQALMKNVHPGHAPDVTSLPGHHGPCSPPDALPKPDVTRDSKHRTVMERRREGRYKTFDWAEFRPQNRPAPDPDPDPQRTGAPRSPELGDLERRKRREERRRRYESMLGISLCWQAGGEEPAGGSVGALKVEEDVEECWRLVEKTVLRPDRAVPLITGARDPAVMEKLLDGYRKEVEDLKAQLEESECLRLELQLQLTTAGNQQQKLDRPPNETTLSSHRQTLDEAYSETRELLQQQNVIRQSLQEQLGCDPPSLTAQTPSVWLHDAEGNIQELRDLLPETETRPLSSPAPDSQDLRPQSDGETERQTQLDRDDSQQVLRSGTQINGECRSLTLEEKLVPADQAVVRKLSQEVELLTSQNEALNQRNQEMLNQLTEADREIARLKAELSSRYSEPYRFPEEEQLERAGAEDLDRELSLRNQELLEARTLITSLEENLRETEALLQLNSAADSEGAGRERSTLAEKAEGYLLCCLEANEARLSELERRLAGTEASCGELREQNAELQEAEKRHLQAAAEAEADIRRLNQELEEERSKGGGDRRVSGEERVQQVIEGAIVRLNALEKLLEVIDKSDVGWRKEPEETVASQLKWEEEFWSSVHSKLNSSQLPEEEHEEELLREATERMIVENQMMLLGHGLLPETEEGRMFDLNNRLWEMKHFRVVTRMKISSLNRLASAVISSAQDGVQPMEDGPCSSRPWSGFIHSAATEALYCCLLNRLRSRHERELEELTSCRVCSNCVDLTAENGELKAKLEEQQCLDEKRSACWQTEEIQPQDPEGLMEEEEARETPEKTEGETVEPLPRVEGQLGGRKSDAGDPEERDASFEAEQVSVLRRRVKELEEQLNLREEELKEEHEEKMSSAQTQHEREMEKLKVACERGFASMEESHVKIVEELQRRHRQEEEHLLVERERLLEEESAATATALEAIRNAHRQELEKEVQKRCRSEERAGSAHLEDVYRQHSEELTSFQRELQVLSQQFSLKCLENGHLVQALDAERKALCQCQQENQDLRTRNQELSGHLAAEITRLCSLAKQDELPLSQGMDVYELEITLRVKESEVQCLKQEVASLKDELQSAQRDKRNATKKYKDVLTELSITRAKTERELDELRENLRLARRALDPDSP